MKSDDELRQDVIDELGWGPTTDTANVRVAAREGVVTLTGQVLHFSSKMLAERAAKRVAGVRAVANDIAVLSTAETARTDTEIATAAVHALEWDTQVPDQLIQVTVRDGRLTLQGVVEWGFQREAAELAVHNLAGVRHVLNAITVRPRGPAADVKGRIEAAFRRSAELDAAQIQVEAHEGRVTLRGRVGSWAERVAAERAAWAAPGVSDVDNRLLVT